MSHDVPSVAINRGVGGGGGRGLVPSNKTLENILKMTEVGGLVAYVYLKLIFFNPESSVAILRICGGSDTGTWWLRYWDVVAQIRGRGGSDTGTWWLRYGDVVAQIRYVDVLGVAQIRGRVCSDTGTWWLRYGDGVAQKRGRGGSDTGT